MKCIDYKTDKIKEVKESVGLNFLYESFLGRVILKIMISKPVAKIYSKYQNSKLSVHKIHKFIKKNSINMDEYEPKEYSSFNDFFMRKIKLQNRKCENAFVSPCDAKLSVYKIEGNQIFNIKNSIYTLEEITRENMDSYAGGTIAIFRLTVDDYHRYIFPFDGEMLESKKIDGILHTVQPIAFKKYKVFKENSRVVTKVRTNDYGIVYIVEVGAMMIGKIINENTSKFKKGDEKGHFEFGGSTIIYIFEKNKINFDSKIFDNTENGYETIVKQGWKL